MPPTDHTNDLRQKLTHAEAVIAELRRVMAELRKQVESQQAHIHRLVKITFGRGGERVEGPTLFDGMVVPEAVVALPEEPLPPEAPSATKRKGHGRRCKPKDLPRRREEIDLNDAEKCVPGQWTAIEICWVNSKPGRLQVISPFLGSEDWDMTDFGGRRSSQSPSGEPAPTRRGPAAGAERRRVSSFLEK